MVTVIHTMIGYLLLLVVVRVLTRRPGAQLTPFEFVLIFLIGGVIILTTVGDDRSETNSVCAVLAVALMHRLIFRFKLMSDRFDAIADGIPLVLLKNGRWQVTTMDHARVQDADVMASARANDVRTLDRIKYAVLERNGGISIIKAEDE